MIFAKVPVEEAEGAILAHYLNISSERLKKGLLLTADHIVALRPSGCDAITVARLEKDDVGEDKAARLLAESLLADKSNGIRLSIPVTGRVNLFATGPGIICQNVEKLIGLNSIDPMIS